MINCLPAKQDFGITFKGKARLTTYRIAYNPALTVCPSVAGWLDRCRAFRPIPINDTAQQLKASVWRFAFDSVFEILAHVRHLMLLYASLHATSEPTKFVPSSPGSAALLHPDGCGKEWRRELKESYALHPTREPTDNLGWHACTYQSGIVPPRMSLSTNYATEKQQCHAYSSKREELRTLFDSFSNTHIRRKRPLDPPRKANKAANTKLPVIIGRGRPVRRPLTRRATN